MSEIHAETAAPAEPASAESQFTLAGLLLFVTWIGTCFAAIAAGNAIAIVTTVIAVPAIVRTVALARNLRKVGHPLRLVGLAINFCASLGLVVSCCLLAIWFTAIVGYACVAAVQFLGLPVELVWVIAVFPFAAYSYFLWVTWSARIQI